MTALRKIRTLMFSRHQTPIAATIRMSSEVLPEEFSLDIVHSSLPLRTVPSNCPVGISPTSPICKVGSNSNLETRNFGRIALLRLLKLDHTKTLLCTSCVTFHKRKSRFCCLIVVSLCTRILIATDLHKISKIVGAPPYCGRET